MTTNSQSQRGRRRLHQDSHFRTLFHPFPWILRTERGCVSDKRSHLWNCSPGQGRRLLSLSSMHCLHSLTEHTLPCPGIKCRRKQAVSTPSFSLLPTPGEKVSVPKRGGLFLQRLNQGLEHTRQRLAPPLSHSKAASNQTAHLPTTSAHLCPCFST